MSLVADFFKGTADTLLEKLVKPAGLLPAAAFVLLNLAFIYPTARDEQLGWATSFKNLGAGWQVVTIAGLSLLIGLVLQGASVAVMLVLEGTAWQDTPLGGFFTGRQKEKLRSARDALDHLPEDQVQETQRQRANQEWKIERSFAVEASASASDQEDIAPTALGNALKALQHTIFKRYGIDVVPLLGHLQATDKVKDSPALAAADDQQQGLQLFSNLAAVLSLFALECLAFYGKRGHWGAALLGASALPAAYGAYQVAVGKARAWSDAVGALFDLHRGDLRTQLKLREPADAEDELDLWKQASQFFRPPGKLTAGDLFDPPASSSAVITIDGDLEASAIQASEVELERGAVSGATPLTGVSYRLLVARTKEAAWLARSEILVADPRISVIEAAPVPLHDVSARGFVIDDGVAVSLCWRFERLQRGASLLLAYILPIWVVSVARESNGEDQIQFAFARPDGQGRFRIFPSRDPEDGATHRVTARYFGSGAFTLPSLTQAGNRLGGNPSERKVEWHNVSFAAAAGVVTLVLGTTEGGAG